MYLLIIYILGKNAVLMPGCNVDAIQDDITTQTVPIWLAHIAKPIKI